MEQLRTPEQRYEEFLERIDRALRPPVVSKRKKSDKPAPKPRVRMIGDSANYAATPDIDIRGMNLTSIEAMVLFTEATRRVKEAAKNSTAHLWLARAVSYAEKVASQIRGDDEGVRFYTQVLAKAEEQYPDMATDMGTILDVAFDRRLFETRRK